MGEPVVSAVRRGRMGAGVASAAVEAVDTIMHSIYLSLVIITGSVR